MLKIFRTSFAFIACLAIPAMALVLGVELPYYDDGLDCTVDFVNDGARILRINSVSDGKLKLPTYVYNRPVVEIAFEACCLTSFGITGIELPRKVKRIHAKAFYSTSEYSPSSNFDIVFPETLEQLDRWAFGKRVLYTDAGTTSVYRWKSYIRTAYFEGPAPTVTLENTNTALPFPTDGNFGWWGGSGEVKVCQRHLAGFTVGEEHATADRYLGGQLSVGVPAPPAISPSTETFEGFLDNIILTKEDDSAVLYYTLDGTDPEKNGILYERPIRIFETTTIRVISQVPGYEIKSRSERTYTCLSDRRGCKTYPVVLSSEIRKNDPTIMDVQYHVVSDKPTVDVRALAFQDGERSFWKAVRVTEFVNDPDGNPTKQNIGDNIAANVDHKLSWKVSKDWKTDLAKVKFEVLCSNLAQLPLKLNHIKAVGKYPALTIGVGTQTDSDIFNALLWWYADGDENLVNTDGYVDAVGVDCVGGTRWVNRTVISGARMDIEKWLYAKMGYEPLVGGDLMSYVRTATRKELWWNSSTRNCVVKTDTKPTELYVGEKAYWAVDLITGAEEYLDSVPLAGWGDEYKTTKLLFRRIEPGLVTVGGTKPVTLTKPFYMGVFELTQKQYELIVGSNPSSYKGEMRPVECVSYNDIRGTSEGTQCPIGTEFDEESFLGKLKAKIRVTFDLPTEAQWEYACRAGTSSPFNNGASGASDLKLLGRHSYNRDDGHGAYSEHTMVGSYLPNAWGLYDMHGNVVEWCLDGFGELNSDPAIDWTGADSGGYRVLRGGCWDYGYNYSHCESSERSGNHRFFRDYAVGFRLLRTLAQ